jgi:dienelactone hydrolase
MLTLIRKAALTVVLASALTALTAVSSEAGTHQPSSGTRVIVENVWVPVPGQHAVPAYLVESAGVLAPRSRAGILFLHWLGPIHGDRTEFLPEAIGLAAQGSVSLLPQGTFPWEASPTGTKKDVTAVEQQLAAFQACLTWLMAMHSVDASRVAVVGHDYGAMYGALLANGNPEVHAAVLETPDATWGHWFVKYWLGYTGQRAARYEGLFAGLEPVRHASRLGDRELFQWAGKDIYVSASVRQRFARYAPQAEVDFYPTAHHQLDNTAEIARDTFLEHELGLS